MFKKNTDRLIIISLNISCQSQEEDKIIKYLKANLPVALKRRPESISCETSKSDADEFPTNIHVEFLLGLMETLRVTYGISHLLFLVMKKFEKIGISIDGEEISSEMTDEELKKRIKTIYEQLKKEKD